MPVVTACVHGSDVLGNEVGVAFFVDGQSIDVGTEGNNWSARTDGGYDACFSNWMPVVGKILWEGIIIRKKWIVLMLLKFGWRRGGGEVNRLMITYWYLMFISSRWRLMMVLVLNS